MAASDTFADGSDPTQGVTVKLSPEAMQGLLAAGAAGVTRELRGWQPPSVEALQQMLPQYEISGFIARGGMGAVYKGMQTALKRTVAIKVLPPEIEDGDMQYVARFKHEAQAMARLSHPNIVAVFDAGEVEMGRVDGRGGALGPPSAVSDARRLEDPPPYPDGGLGTARPTLLYFVMEFIEGTDVAQLIASEGIVEPLRAIQITTAVCEALAFAHEEGIIHRDIKPSNIMIDRKGRVKVADFGLAKTVNLESTLLTGSNVAMGTPDFIAPEALIPGIAVDGRADLYAVGVMLYQMLTGKVPRGRFSPVSVVVPKTDKRLDRIVDKAMQTDREKRYSTAGEMKTDVERISRFVLPKATGAGTNQEIRSTGKGRSPLLIAAVIALVGAAAFLMMKNPDSAPVSSSSSLPISQSSAPEPAAIKLWDTPEKLPADTPKTTSRWDNGAVKLTGQLRDKDAVFQNGIVRASVRMNPGAQPQLLIRHSVRGGSGTDMEKTSTYSLYVSVSSTNFQLGRNNNGTITKLKEWPFLKSYATNEWARLEVRLMNDEITVTADGELVGAVRDTAPLSAGNVAINAKGDSYFRDIEYVPLDKPPASSSPSLPISQSSAGPAAAKANAAWKARWHKPGKLRAAGVDRLGKTLDLKAAEPFDDFVQVAVVDPNYFNGRSWAALRSTGDLVWSDGFTESGKIGLVRSQAGVFSIGTGGAVALPAIRAPEPVFDVSCTSLSVLPSKPHVMAWADEKGGWQVSSTAYDTGLLEKPDLTTDAKVTRIVVANQAVGVLREDGSLRIWSVKELPLPALISRDITDVLPMGEIWAVLKKDGSILKFPLKKSAKDAQLVLPTEADISSGWKAKAMTSGGFSLVFQRHDGRWTTDMPGLVEDTLAKLHGENNEAFSIFREGDKGGLVWIEPTK